MEHFNFNIIIYKNYWNIVNPWQNFHKAMGCIQQYKIDKYVLRCILVMDVIDIWHPSLDPVIVIPNKKHVPWEFLKFLIRY